MTTEFRLLNGDNGWLSMANDPERWPLLVRALREPALAYSPKIEWLVDKICPTCHQGHVRDHDFNYTQIFRTTIFIGDSKKESLHKHWDEIETALREGTRHFEAWQTHPVTKLGGVFDLIGRWPQKQDILSLRILRETIMRESESGGEWLSEVSLMAIRKEAPRGTV